jgi:hypothetical protein
LAWSKDAGTTDSRRAPGPPRAAAQWWANAVKF